RLGQVANFVAVSAGNEVTARSQAGDSAMSNHMTPARRWCALAALTLPVLVLSIDITVLGFALPALSESLSPSGSQLLWIVDMYGFVPAGLLVLMGVMGDRVGRRKLLVIGSA